MGQGPCGIGHGRMGMGMAACEGPLKKGCEDFTPKAQGQGPNHKGPQALPKPQGGKRGREGGSVPVPWVTPTPTHLHSSLSRTRPRSHNRGRAINNTGRARRLKNVRQGCALCAKIACRGDANRDARARGHHAE